MAGINKLVLAVIPNQKCNLRCEYCYISQIDDWKDTKDMGYSPEYIAKCLSVKRLGGVSLINLTGNGETMLQYNIVDIIRCFLNEGHYVEVVTNGTIRNKFEKIALFPRELLDRLFFKISFHYRELRRLNMLDIFYDTVNLLKKNNIAFTLELLAYDKIENEIDEIIKSCISNVGAICHATIGRSDVRKRRNLLSVHTQEEYQMIWNKLDSPMQNFKLKILGVKRKEFCYAGAWSLFIDMYTGYAKSCYRQPFCQNIFNDISRPIKFIPVGHYCMQPYCINGHAHLTWGVIPELKTPCYFDMRNKKCNDGTNWINNECKNFFMTRLYDTNHQYSLKRRVIHTVYYPVIYVYRMLWSLRLNMSRGYKLWSMWKKTNNDSSGEK